MTKTNKLPETLKQKLEVEESTGHEFPELKRRFGWEFNGMRRYECYFDTLDGNGVADSDSQLAHKKIEDSGSINTKLIDLKSVGPMRGAVKNDDFRRVLYTAKYCQLVVMALKTGDEMGAEVHNLGQFFRIEEGSGEAVLNGVRTSIQAGFALVASAGVNHNIINTGSVPLKLYTLYAPPNHRDGVVHHTQSTMQQPIMSTLTAKRRNRA